MKRAILAAGFVVILLIAGALLIPRMQGDYALAEVARAMARVRSAHFGGWYTDHASGERRKLEGWARGGSQIRFSLEGESEEYFDRDRLVRVRFEGPEAEAVMMPAKNAEPQFTLSLFRGPAAIRMLLEETDGGVVTSGRRTLPSGGKAVVYEVRARRSRWLIYADPQTKLLMRFEAYTGGMLDMVVERFEYDLDIPNSVFEPAIPGGMPVVDLITPPSPEKLAWREKEKQRLVEEGADIAISLASGRDEAPYHPGYYFECMDAGKLLVFYMPDERVYRVLGTARIRGPKGYSRLVEDGDVRLPGEPDIYRVVMKDGKPGTFGSGSGTIMGFEPLRFLNVGKGPLTVKWDKSRTRFEVRGKAKLIPLGDVYENQAVPITVTMRKRLEHGENLDWTGLPSGEEAVSREEVEIVRRAKRLVTPFDPMKPGANAMGNIKGGDVENLYWGEYRRDGDFAIEAAGRALPYIYVVPSRQECYVVGHARVKARGQRDRPVANAVVGFDGKVIGSID